MHTKATAVYMHIGTGRAYELPEYEVKRRLEATTAQCPLMNVILNGVSRDQLMSRHNSNHITVAYVPEKNFSMYLVSLFLCLML